MSVIITDTGIIIEDNKHRSITGGVITVGHDMIEQAIFITFDSKEVNMNENTFCIGRIDIMSCTALSELPDALCRQGWFIIMVIVSKSGTEVAYVKANLNRCKTSKEAIEAIKKYTSYR